MFLYAMALEVGYGVVWRSRDQRAPGQPILECTAIIKIQFCCIESLELRFDGSMATNKYDYLEEANVGGNQGIRA